MRRALLALSLVVLATPSVRAAAPHPYLDLGFEASECTAGWLAEPFQNTFDATLDTAVVHSGRQSLRIETGPQQYGAYDRDLPLSFRGQTVRLSGYARTEGVTGFAGLWWGAYNANGQIFSSAHLSATDGAMGTTPWTRYSIEFDVPDDAVEVVFGAEVKGKGVAWFDSLELEVGGRRWADGPKPRAQKPGAAAVSWVRRRAIPFSTHVAGNGFDDLRPLKSLLANARVVSLGEGTHGTREFFQMKHRLLEFLATEMGFNYFSIEANMPEAERVNQYVLTGVGDPKKLLQGLYFWTWNTQEVLDMIEWMRAYNASGKGPVQFTGFDMQYSAVAAANARTFLSKAEPGYVATADSAFARIATADKTRKPAPGDLEAAQAVYDHFVERRGDYLSRFPAEEVDWAVQNARVVLQDIQQISGTVLRDESMAENAGWILDHAPAGSKIVLWAHNGHVSKDPGAMGSYLAQRYGNGMYVLGFAFGEGSYNAVGPQGLRSYEALPPVQGSLETLFEAARLPRFILDVRQASGEAATWLNKPQNFRSVGAVAIRCSFYPTVVSKLYDGLIWINPTSPSTLLPFQ